MKTCNECRFAIFEDFGYSNWTVEGTYMNCAKYKHPDAPFDRFYGTDERLNFAEKCDSFEKGDSIDMDVDREHESDLTPEQNLVYELWQNPVATNATDSEDKC
jgi:hypothetical protein